MKGPTIPQGSDLLPYIQAIDPITARPFLDVAERIGLSENEVVAGVRSLIHDKVVREFGPVFDPRRLGYVSTLVAARADKDRVSELAAAMLTVNEITHNYYRDGEFNLWFTITAANRMAMDGIIRWVDKFPGVSKVLDLPAERSFKISAVFDAAVPEVRAPNGRETIPASPDDRGLVRALQSAFPIVERPFLAIAEELDLDENAILSLINVWMSTGVIRRFGARVSHRRMGFESNALVAWEGSDVETWGIRFAEIPAVSHCYLRTPHPEWPYRLYTMVHARSDREMEKTIAFMCSIAEGSGHVLLRTLYELKKTSMKYFMEK